MNPVSVQITGTSKPWVLRINALHPIYGFAGDFMPISSGSSMRCNEIEITAEGYYKLPTPKDAKVVAASRKRTTGYIHVSAEGVTDVTKEQVVIAPDVSAN